MIDIHWLRHECLQVVSDWKMFWSNQTQNSPEDQQNYFHRAFGIDSNMKHNLADRMNRFVESKLAPLQAEIAMLKNTIGHWQIKNDALGWDKVSARIQDLESDLEIVRDTLDGQRAINDRSFAEKEALRSLLKVAKEALALTATAESVVHLVHPECLCSGCKQKQVLKELGGLK